MKILAVETPPYIYHGYSAQKTFWEKKVTQNNRRNCGLRNVRENREIRNGEQCIDLDISLNFVSTNKMKIISLEPKYYLRRSGKWLITSLGFKTIRSSKNINKVRFAINEVSLKNIFKIIRESMGVHYKGYVSESSRHMPTDSYFYL